MQLSKEIKIVIRDKETMEKMVASVHLNCGMILLEFLVFSSAVAN